MSFIIPQIPVSPLRDDFVAMETEDVSVRSPTSVDFDMSSDSDDMRSAPDLSMIDVSHGSFVVPEVLHESSLLENPVDVSVASDSESVVTWHKITGGTKRGGDKLTNSLGYSYVANKIRPSSTYWLCSVRNKNTKCSASVTEKDNVFSPGVHEHCHPPVAGATELTEAQAVIRREAKAQPFAPAFQIAEMALVEHYVLVHPALYPRLYHCVQISMALLLLCDYY